MTWVIVRVLITLSCHLMALYESINACSINISPLYPSDHCVVKLTLGYDVLARHAMSSLQFRENLPGIRPKTLIYRGTGVN